MTARTHAKDDYDALKFQTRALIKLNGGLDNTASVTRPGRSMLSDYGNARMNESFIPADVIMDLETEAGQPVITRQLARSQGYELHKVDYRDEISPQWALHLAGVGKEIGEFFAKAQTALANGNDIDAGEIRTHDLIREADEALEAIAKVRSALIARREGVF